MANTGSSACDIMLEEPKRFVDYLLSDPKVRNKIYDDESLVQAMRQVLKQDVSLQNLVDDIDNKKIDLKSCLQGVFDDTYINSLMKNNLQNKRKQIKTRVKNQYPNLKGKKLTAEINRRLSLSLSQTKTQIKKLKQTTIQDALKPVTVEGYVKDDGTKVKGYSRTKSRPLTKAEEMLIKNNLKKTPNQVVDLYLKSGLTFRTPESIKGHYYRMKMNP